MRTWTNEDPMHRRHAHRSMQKRGHSEPSHPHRGIHLFYVVDVSLAWHGECSFRYIYQLFARTTVSMATSYTHHLDDRTAVDNGQCLCACGLSSGSRCRRRQQRASTIDGVALLIMDQRLLFILIPYKVYIIYIICIKGTHTDTHGQVFKF